MTTGGKAAVRWILRWQTRAIVVFVVCFIACAVGVSIYLAHAGGSEYKKMLPMAVMFFPIGITAFLPGKMEPVVGLVYGWIFYAALIVALLINNSAKIFTSLVVVFAAVLFLNLYGCAQILAP